MPSAHSTFVVALSTAMGLKYSVWSDEFTMALVFSIVIIYDAMNVRYQS
jgi:acid phosphatase family membrane protein YuiD